MKKQKRFLSGLLAGFMLIALSACGQQPQNSDQSQQAATASPQAVESDGIVQTTAGQVRGADQDGVLRYLGVPYAQAAERFVPAGDVELWEGVLAADTYGPMSPQGSISGIDGSSDQSGTDNNCQNLNIWTPGVGDG